MGAQSGFDAATLRFYAEEATAYAATDWPENARLSVFLDRLNPGARILDFGCGGGRDAVTMLARGFDVDPTDGVPEMAREAEAFTGRPVKVMRFDELDAVGAYDAVWANASLLHVPWADLPAVLQQIWRALKPGGFHFANFKCGERDGRDRFDRYYNYPTPDALVETYLGAAEWEIVQSEESVGGGYDGVRTPWIAVTVRKG